MATTIAARAQKLGISGQAAESEEPQRQHVVDYAAVEQGWDKVVQWQQTGKRSY